MFHLFIIMIITHIIKLYNGTQILSCDYYSMLLISKLQLSIGSPYQTVLASIDLFLPFSFIRSDLFDLSRSSTIKQINLPYSIMIIKHTTLFFTQTLLTLKLKSSLLLYMDTFCISSTEIKVTH